VTVNSVPTATISAGGPTSFCEGSNVVLTASAGSTWLWSNGATTQSITVTGSGNFTVIVTNSNGCSATSSTTSVSVSPNPVVTISAAPYSALFPGLNTTLTANVTPPGSYNYTWYRNGNIVPGATATMLTGIKVEDIGSYTVTVTNTSGLACSNTSPALVVRDSASTRLFIYPSPNSGQFKVAYHTTGSNVKLSLNIFDSKGAYVFTQSYTLNSPYQVMNVDMRKFRSGLYRVALNNAAGKRIAVGSVVIH
jgi:hypothetical protein